MSALLPINISFPSWTQQLRNSFPAQDIPLVNNESDWKSFPAMLSSNRCFENSYIPQVAGFTSWQEWASEFLLSIGA